MRKYTLFFLCLFPILAFDSCVKQGAGDPWKCPRNLRVVFDWIDSQPIDQQEQIKLAVVDPDNIETDYLSDIYGRDITLMPKEYDFVGTETATNVTVSGRKVSVAVGGDGLALDPTPFSGGATTAQVTPETEVIHVPMHQQTRELVILVKVGGDLASEVTGMEGTFHGIATSRDINNGFPPGENQNRPYDITRGDIAYSFQAETIPNEIWYSGTRRLIGIDGDNNQDLALTVHFNNGDVRKMTLDATSRMTGFHTQDLPGPWYLIFEIDINLELEMTIVDWIDAPPSWITAN